MEDEKKQKAKQRVTELYLKMEEQKRKRNEDVYADQMESLKRWRLDKRDAPDCQIEFELPEDHREIIASKDMMLAFLKDLVGELANKDLPVHVKGLMENQEKLFASKGKNEAEVWKAATSDTLPYVKHLVSDKAGVHFTNEDLLKDAVSYPDTLFALARTAVYNLQDIKCEVCPDDGRFSLDEGSFSIWLNKDSVQILPRGKKILDYTWKQYGETVMGEIGFGLYCLASGAQHNPEQETALLNLFYCMMFVVTYKIF